MAKLLKLRRGTTTQHGSFTGAEGEVTVDTDKETLVVHDGSTAGGHPVAAEDMANVTAANIKGRLGSTITNTEINSSAAIAGTKIAPDFGSQNVATTGTLGCGEITTTGHINLEDNKNLKLGNSADLLIYHNGNHSIINDNGTGDLQLVTNQGTQITLQGGSDTMANFIKDGKVELYYDNSKKLETTSSGIDVSGRVTADDLTVENTSGNLSAFFTATNGLGTLEVGGSSGAFIDLKTPASDDYDIRIDASGTLTSVAGIALNTASGSAVSVQRDLNVGGNVSGTLANGVTATTQSASDNSTKVATTAYTDTAISNLVDSSPSTLNTLNELAAALGDDANFSTTVTNSIATKMPLSGGTFTGAVTGTTIADSKGDLRSIPANSKSSAYTLVSGDAGKAIYISSGGVTVPSSIFASGNAITIVNDSGSNQTISQGSGLSLYNTADASTGNRTLLPRGMATVWFASTATAYISGSGLE